MEEFYWPGNSEPEAHADVTQWDHVMDRPESFAVEPISPRMLRWPTQAWIAALSFIVLWTVASRVSDIWFSHYATARVIDLWIALDGVIVVNAFLVARRKRGS